MREWKEQDTEFVIKLTCLREEEKCGLMPDWVMKIMKNNSLFSLLVNMLPCFLKLHSHLLNNFVLTNNQQDFRLQCHLHRQILWPIDFVSHKIIYSPAGTFPACFVLHLLPVVSDWCCSSVLILKTVSNGIFCQF